MTQEQVSERLGISVEMIRRHERGDSRPGERFRRGYVRLYRATERDLGLTAPGGGSAATQDPPVLSMPVAVRAGDRLGPDDLPGLHRHMRQLVVLDNQFGGNELVRVAGRFLRSLTRQVGAGLFEPTIRTDLYAAIGELAEITGWLAFDAGRHDLVRRMNQESLYYSRLAGDTSVELLTVQNAGMHAGHLGRAYEALQLAESALSGPYRLSPRLRALFLVRRSRALAQGGDRAALRTLDEAMSLYDDGVSASDPQWVWWIDQRELWWHEAMCRSDLGDTSGALDAFARSADAVSAGETRSRFTHWAYLARAQVKARSWADARVTLDVLQPLALHVASDRTAAVIRAATAELRELGATAPADVVSQAIRLDTTVAEELGAG
ncbi:helix-turn-helix domain-containing protein [Pseudonocardia sp. HH130630-07]|uniref:helix-turn-helix domain-containing protein n=1 Tax=Pseudonocardia sp. HH130630-07 TaxID=1690815 RepID=UPI000814F177|nr:helix-turn-helix transcriptional regulator [Pseudonocardia sp. HH130630-07]ANY05369.1 hypothetical protein AFB00_02505 [Pseudonocardia sp. HH130630-07]